MTLPTPTNTPVYTNKIGSAQATLAASLTTGAFPTDQYSEFLALIAITAESGLVGNATIEIDTLDPDGTPYVLVSDVRDMSAFSDPLYLVYSIGPGCQSAQTSIGQTCETKITCDDGITVTAKITIIGKS